MMTRNQNLTDAFSVDREMGSQVELVVRVVVLMALLLAREWALQAACQGSEEGQGRRAKHAGA